MIEAVGYTNDGMVFVTLGMEIRGEKLKGNLVITSEVAISLSKDLAAAAKEADRKKCDVGNSANFN